MKNAAHGRRRDRRIGLSPYQRHNKKPRRYSSSYYEWRNRMWALVGKREQEMQAYHAERKRQRNERRVAA